MTDDKHASTESPTVEYADIEQWYRRFNRAMSMFSEEHDEDGFNDLVAVSVAGVTLEAFLHIGIGIVDPNLKRDCATLGRLITFALQRGVVSQELGPLLEGFCDIRNAVAHFIDYRVDDAAVDELYDLMPASERSRMDAAVRNILDGPLLGTRLRIVLMSAFHATDLDIRANVWRVFDERGIPPLAG
jgi:uncharacterized protein YutE (UPF0331/DUF86 family)